MTRYLHRLCVIACMMFLSTAAVAETVSVKSGEHENFTRLVIHLPKKVEWDISGKGRTKTITFRNLTPRWNTSDVFRKIDRKRIKNIDARDGSEKLHIELNCLCEADIHWGGGSMLVVDISDPAPDKAAESAVDPDANSDGFVSRRGAGQKPILSLTDHFTSPVSHANSRLRESINAISEKEVIVREDSMLDPLTLEVERNIRQAERYDLVESGDAGAPLGTSARPDSIDSGRDEHAVSPVLTSDKKNIKFHSSLNPVMLEPVETDTPAPANSQTCIPDEYLSFSNWGTEESFQTQIGSLREEMMKESDPVSADANLKLVRLYLYFGFGAEARVALQDLEIADVEKEVYLGLSRIFDNADSGLQVFSDQMMCEGKSSLWSLLAAGDLSANDRLNADAMIAAFLDLPTGLKNIVGRNVASRLRQAGDLPAASIVREMAAQLGANGDASGGYATASTDPERDERPLESSGQHGLQSLLSLIEELDIKFGTASPISEDTAYLIGSFAHEQRGTSLGKTLEHTRIRALAASGKFAMAFEDISALGVNPEDLDTAGTAGIVATYTVRNADDITFLKHLGLHRSEVFKDIPASIDSEISDRLASLGFASAASTPKAAAWRPDGNLQAEAISNMENSLDENTADETSSLVKSVIDALDDEHTGRKPGPTAPISGAALLLSDSETLRANILENIKRQDSE